MITKRFNKLLQRLVNDIVGWICGDKHVRCQRVDGWQHRAELLFQLLLQPGPQHATNAIAEHRQQHVVQPTARSNHECREHMRVQLAWCYATNLAAASVMDVVSEGSANSKLSCFSCGLPFTATIASRMLTLASLITQSHCPVQGPTVVPRLAASGSCRPNTQRTTHTTEPRQHSTTVAEVGEGALSKRPADMV